MRICRKRPHSGAEKTRYEEVIRSILVAPCTQTFLRPRRPHSPHFSGRRIGRAWAAELRKKKTAEAPTKQRSLMRYHRGFDGLLRAARSPSLHEQRANQFGNT